MAETDPTVRDAVLWARHWRTVELKAERDRLREERDKFEQHKDAWRTIAESAKGERDRLREALQALHDAEWMVTCDWTEPEKREALLAQARAALGPGSEGESG